MRDEPSEEEMATKRQVSIYFFYIFFIPALVLSAHLFSLSFLFADLGKTRKKIVKQKVRDDYLRTVCHLVP